MTARGADSEAPPPDDATVVSVPRVPATARTPRIHVWAPPIRPGSPIDDETVRRVPLDDETERRAPVDDRTSVRAEALPADDTAPGRRATPSPAPAVGESTDDSTQPRRSPRGADDTHPGSRARDGRMRRPMRPRVDDHPIRALPSARHACPPPFSARPTIRGSTRRSASNAPSPPRGSNPVATPPSCGRGRPDARVAGTAHRCSGGAAAGRGGCGGGAVARLSGRHPDRSARTSPCTFARPPGNAYH